MFLLVTLMVKGNDEFARGRIPELGDFVGACRQDPPTVRTNRNTGSEHQSLIEINHSPAPSSRRAVRILVYVASDTPTVGVDSL
jgi:hypothetical protein